MCIRDRKTFLPSTNQINKSSSCQGTFHSLGWCLQNDGCSNEDVQTRINAAWIQWKEVTGVISVTKYQSTWNLGYITQWWCQLPSMASSVWLPPKAQNTHSTPWNACVMVSMRILLLDQCQQHHCQTTSCCGYNKQENETKDDSASMDTSFEQHHHKLSLFPGRWQ